MKCLWPVDGMNPVKVAEAMSEVPTEQEAVVDQLS
jgi:hypothetical protein